MVEEPIADAPGLLTVATCQFPVSADVARNGRYVMRQIATRLAAEHMSPTSQKHAYRVTQVSTSRRSTGSTGSSLPR